MIYLFMVAQRFRFWNLITNCSLMLMHLNSLKISERNNALKNNVYLDDLKISNEYIRKKKSTFPFKNII